MMLRMFKYSNINAKLRAMFVKELNNNFVEELVKQDDLNSAILVLNSNLESIKDIPEDATRIQLEQALDNVLIRDIQKIITFLDNESKEILFAYLLKYKINILKIIWHNLNSNDSIPDSIDVKNWVMKIFKELSGIEKVTTKEEFLEKIKNDVEIFDIFSQSDNIFVLENKLDKYYFFNLLKKLDTKYKNVRDITCMQIDLLNIVWIYRCKKYYNMTDFSYLIPQRYKLNKKILNKLSYCETVNDIAKNLKGSIYDGVIKNNLERDIKFFIAKKYIKNFHFMKYDIGTVISYLFLEEIRKENVITIIEGIRYQVPKEKIMENIIFV